MTPPPPLPVSQAAQPPSIPALDVRTKHVYMVGVGGCGMSGLARLIRARGGLVEGSDAYPSPFTDALLADGIDVGFDQSRQWLPDACDLVIASAAIKPDHPQILEADRRGIPHLNYAEALGRAMIGSTGICIAGTHGKSTTTAMLGYALSLAGLDPSVIVGATCPQLAEVGGTGGGSGGGGGFRLGAQAIPQGPLKGKPGVLIVEACEYNRSFHNYRPTIAAITSVEADHLDIYGSLEAIIEAFRDFARLLPSASEGGVLLIGENDTHRRDVTAGLTCAVQTIGYSPSADWQVRYDPRTRNTGLIRRGEGLVAAWMTNMPGQHNAMNAATACALAIIAGADPDQTAQALGDFKGLHRRMQHLGTRQFPGYPGKNAELGVKVYDDYGHHPTEVGATLRALRDFEKPEKHGGRLVCVFQPHQHSRTRFLLDEFASAFSDADVVIVPHIYFVRDSIAERQKVSAADLVDKLRGRGVQAMHLYPFEAIIEQLENVCKPGDLLVVMGAGPVDAVAKGYLASGEAKNHE